LGTEEAKEKNTTKAMKGVFKKANLKPLKHLAEFKLNDGEELKPGQEIKIEEVSHSWRPN